MTNPGILGKVWLLTLQIMICIEDILLVPILYHVIEFFLENRDFRNVSSMTKIYREAYINDLYWDFTLEASAKYYTNAYFRMQVNSLINDKSSMLAINLNSNEEVDDISILGNLDRLDCSECNNLKVLTSNSNIRNLDASENELVSVNLTGVYEYLDLQHIVDLDRTNFISIGTVDCVVIDYSGIRDISFFQSVNRLSMIGCQHVRFSGLSNKHIEFCGCSKAHFNLPENYTFRDLHVWKTFPDLPHCSTLKFRRSMCDYCRSSRAALFRR